MSGRPSKFEMKIMGDVGYLVNMVEMIYEKLGLCEDGEALNRQSQRIRDRNPINFRVPNEQKDGS